MKSQYALLYQPALHTSRLSTPLLVEQPSDARATPAESSNKGLTRARESGPQGLICEADPRAQADLTLRVVWPDTQHRERHSVVIKYRNQ